MKIHRDFAAAVCISHTLHVAIYGFCVIFVIPYVFISPAPGPDPILSGQVYDRSVIHNFPASMLPASTLLAIKLASFELARIVLALLLPAGVLTAHLHGGISLGNKIHIIFSWFILSYLLLNSWAIFKLY